MTATHIIKFTRKSIEDQWPFSHFLEVYARNALLTYMPGAVEKDNKWNPLSIQSSAHLWHSLPGFVDYNYSEYDPMSDIKAEKLIEERNDTIDLVTLDRKMAFNPSSLTFTQNITFDTFANLKSFLLMANEHWFFPTKEEVFRYIAEKGITVSEETQVDGNVVVDSVKLFS